MTGRETQIQKNQESREKAVNAYEQGINEIEENLKAAKALSDKIREELEKEALQEKKRLLEEINAECARQVEKAKKQLKEKIKSSKRELESETEVLAEKIEKRLLH